MQWAFPPVQVPLEGLWPTQDWDAMAKMRRWQALSAKFPPLDSQESVRVHFAIMSYKGEDHGREKHNTRRESIFVGN